MLLKPGQLNPRYKTVPGGSHWFCSGEGCKSKFRPGQIVYATGHKRYCARCELKLKTPAPPKSRVKRRPRATSMVRSHLEDND